MDQYEQRDGDFYYKSTGEKVTGEEWLMLVILADLNRYTSPVGMPDEVKEKGLLAKVKE